MEGLPKDVLNLIQFLLPGFLAAWVFYGFTSYPRPSQFERVIQALIFTLFCQLLVFVIHSGAVGIGTHVALGPWTSESETIASIGSGFLVGIVFSYFANTDKFHRWARILRLTRETSYPSEWFSAFLRSRYVVLHLKDERRLFGWPTEWPSDPTAGHFFLQDVSWLDNDGKEISLPGTNGILLDVCEVKWIEFLEFIGRSNEQERLDSAAAASAVSSAPEGN